MRPYPIQLRHLMLIAAPLALAACNNADDDLAGEALSAEEITELGAEIVPTVGEYRTTQELVSLEVPGAPPAAVAAMRAAFAEGASGEETTYCVADDQSLEDWVTDMAESNCNVTSFTADGGVVDAVLACNSTDGGIIGQVGMKGTATDTSADMEMSFRQPLPDASEAMITMRVTSQRVGDCS